MVSPEMLERRAGMVRRMRSFFDGRGFVEVETPVRIAAPAPEEHIDCPPVMGPGGAVTYLRASPELQMKKLLASGMERIYQIGPCFREGEKGSRHSPEFTMLEWYRRGATYADLMRDAEELLRELFAAQGDGRAAAAARTVTVREAYLRHAGWDPWAGWDQDRFDFDMATKVEPALREIGGCVFLTDYPPQAASLSRLRGDVAERWELYYDGMELANCFSELCDRDEQARRFASAAANRRELGEADYPMDGEFLDALSSIGAAAGAALGVDRLVMVLAGERDISSVRAPA